MMNRRPYPAHCCTPKLEAFSQALASEINAPTSMVGPITLAAATTAMQHRVNITITKDFTTNISMFTCVIADSGEGKSQCTKRIFSVFQQIQKKHIEITEREKIKFKSEKTVWLEIQKELKKELREAYRNNEPTKEIENRLQTHHENEPIEPHTTRLIIEDTTPESLLNELHKGGGSAILLCDELAKIKNTRLASNIALLNELWNSKPIYIDRKSSSNYALTGYNFGLLILSQPEPFKSFINNQKSIARESGFAARVLFACIDSSQGTRHRELKPAESKATEEFEERILELYADSGKIELTLSTAAQKAWMYIANYYEQQMRPGGLYASAKDFASKAPEHIARMAAVLHTFEFRGETEIQERTLRSAAEIIDWHGHEFLHAMNTERSIDEDAHELLSKLMKSHISGTFNGQMVNGLTGEFLSTLYYYAPSRMRNKTKLHAVIDHLCTQNLATKVKISNRTAILVNNPTSYTLPMNFRFTTPPKIDTLDTSYQRDYGTGLPGR